MLRFNMSVYFCRITLSPSQGMPLLCPPVWLTEPLWTDPGLRSGISAHELSPLKKMHRWGMIYLTVAWNPHMWGKSHHNQCGQAPTQIFRPVKLPVLRWISCWMAMRWTSWLWSATHLEHVTQHAGSARSSKRASLGNSLASSFRGLSAARYWLVKTSDLTAKMLQQNV